VKQFAKILNRALPSDIRVLDCVEVPESFHARFDCLSREYMYFFMRRSLNVRKMDEACQLLLGSHDFRNLCKMNVVQEGCFIRAVLSAGVYPAESLFFAGQGWEHLASGSKMETSAVGPESRPCGTK